MKTKLANCLEQVPENNNNKGRGMMRQLTEEIEACYRLSRLPIYQSPTLDETGASNALIQRIYRRIKKEGLKADVVDVLCNLSIEMIVVKVDQGLEVKGMPSSLNVNQFISKGSEDGLIRNAVRLAMRNPKLMYDQFTIVKGGHCYRHDDVIELINRLLHLGADEIIREIS